MIVTFSVSINNVTGAAPADGFIDNTTIEQYIALGSTPTTYAISTAKYRANARYLFMVRQMQMDCTLVINAASIVATGANANTEPSVFSFNASEEHGIESVQTHDELNAGSFLTGTAAVKRYVARALNQTSNLVRIIYDPTTSTAIGGPLLTSVSGIRMPSRNVPLTVGAPCASIAAAEALITVTQIAADTTEGPDVTNSEITGQGSST